MLTVIIWGFHFVVAKAALQVLHPHVFNVLRYSLSTVLMGLLWVGLEPARRNLSEIRSRPRLILAVVVLGLIGHAAYQIFFIEGLDRSTAGTTSLILASVPIWVAVFSVLSRIEILNRLAWMGIAVAFGGTFFVTLAGPQTLDVETGMLGSVLVLLAALAWSIYTTFSKPVLDHISPLALSFWSMLVGIPILWFMALDEWGTVEWATLTPWIWAALFYSGVLSSGLAYVLWQVAIKHVGPSQSAVFGNLVPVLGLISGVIFLDERVVPLQLIGGGLILIGLLIMRRARIRI